MKCIRVFSKLGLSFRNNAILSLILRRREYFLEHQSPRLCGGRISKCLTCNVGYHLLGVLLLVGKYAKYMEYMYGFIN
jgi:hypothetical protein